MGAGHGLSLLERSCRSDATAAVTHHAQLHAQRIESRVAAAAATLLVLALSGCGEDSGPTEPPIGPDTVVGAVRVSPDAVMLLMGETRQLTATVENVQGDTLVDRAVAWSSTDSSVVTVDSTGLVTGLDPGRAAIVATTGPQSGKATVGKATVGVEPAYASISAGGWYYTCALTTGGAAYCWGFNGYGQLGDGSTTDRLVPNRVPGLALAQITAGGATTCGVATSGQAYCWGWYQVVGSEACRETRHCTTPVPVDSPGYFETVSVNIDHACGVTSDGLGYCWGRGDWGQLGNGEPTFSWVPLPVVGGLEFVQISAGLDHTCGVTRDSRAYCWGLGGGGELGVDPDSVDCGTSSPCSAEPVAVSGDLAFAYVGAGTRHVCGLTTSGEAYCWGGNSHGQLGDGTMTASSTPVPVSGGLEFSSLTVQLAHNCGLTADGAAWCWGWNYHGQLGDGTTTSRSTPVPAAGGLRFTVIETGWGHTCGVTAEGVAYCWGANEHGELGDGTTEDRLHPVRVAAPPESRI
jgi:alpha-tubulin suppressor-like RCC1 family protein